MKTAVSQKWLLYLAFLLLILRSVSPFGPGNGCADTGNAEAKIMVSRIEFRVSGDPENTRSLTDLVESLITLREGEPFSPEKLHDSIGSLKKSGLFQSIHVPDPAWISGETKLVFYLTPFGRIRDIKIRGAFPILSREILNAMTLSVGDAFAPEWMEAQRALIAKVFRDEGYLNPKISLSATEAGRYGDITLCIVIEKGEFYRIRKVEFQGNRSFSGGRLKLRTGTWKSTLLFGGGRRFNRKKVDKDVKSLVKFYREKGYAEVEVHPEVNKKKETLETGLIFTIDEGPRYKVRFEGNREFYGFTLKKELVLASQGNQNGLGLRKSIRNIRKRYREAGYPKARISAEEAMAGGADRPVRNIRLVIDEGPREITDSVEFSGNKVFPPEKLKKQMLTQPPGFLESGAFVRNHLEEDKIAIQSLYLKEGYLDLRIGDRLEKLKTPGKDEVRSALTLMVDEGPQTLVQAVAINGLTTVPREEALKSLALESGKPFRSYMVQSDENILSEMISEKGYPHVTVKGSALISEDRTRAEVTYHVVEGPRVTMGPTCITGNFRTKEKVFDKEMLMEPGEPFSLIKMLKTQQNIRNIDALDSADFNLSGLKEKRECVALVVDAKEKKPYYVQLGIGYDTDELLHSNVEIGDHNLLGLNKDGYISGRFSQTGYRGEAGFKEPDFLNTDISLTLNLFAEKEEELNQDFGTRFYGGSIWFNRKFYRHLDATLAFRYENREQYAIDTFQAAPDQQEHFETRNLVVLTPTLVYNTTDSFIRPRHGGYASLSVDFFQGIDNSLDDFIKYKCDLKYYYTPFKRLTLAMHGGVGSLEPYGGNQEVPEDQLFFLGGTTTVRGFGSNLLRFDNDGDPVGGRQSILGSLEARFDLGGNFELAAFFDTGRIRETFVEAGQKANPAADDFRSSLGAGIRYITPIGSVGFMYGWKLDPLENESKGEIHFSIGYTF